VEDLLTGHGIQISMDGKGRCKDNIWIERFWRTIKQEYIYLNPADSVDELRDGIAKIHRLLQLQAPSSELGKECCQQWNMGL
jgi:putative transposase